MSSSVWDGLEKDAECPTCGSRPFEPYEGQHDGPVVVLRCLNDHLYAFDTDVGEVV